jgi:hypothetical protein
MRHRAAESDPLPPPRHVVPSRSPAGLADGCRRAFNTDLGSFAQTYDSDLLDASALLIPQVGFLPPDDRLSALRMADRIITIERGRLIEDGTHDQLIKTGGRYATLYRLQAGPHGVR